VPLLTPEMVRNETEAKNGGVLSVKKNYEEQKQDAGARR
jgi:hypothetical protein